MIRIFYSGLVLLFFTACATAPTSVPVNSFGAAPVQADIIMMGRVIGGQLKSSDPSFVLPSRIPVQLLKDGKVVATQKSGRNGTFRFDGQFNGSFYVVRVQSPEFSGEKSFPLVREEMKDVLVFVSRRR